LRHRSSLQSPHLIPLVEVVGGKKTSEQTVQRAIAFYKSIGKKAVRPNKEMPGHVANRLQGALAREVYYLIAEDVLSAADVDDALSWGPGLRWGIMGNMMLNHLGGGPGGVEHFFHQKGRSITSRYIHSADTVLLSAADAVANRTLILMGALQPSEVIGLKAVG
jgi:3-hydroxyacyl-CoA dehydrogenase